MITDATAGFPAVYRDYPTDRLLEAFAAGPDRVRHVLAGLTFDQLRARPIPGKWSIIEIAGHLADSELMGAGRMRLALCQPGASVIRYNQEVWTERLGHQHLGAAALEEALELFGVLRRTTHRPSPRRPTSSGNRPSSTPSSDR